MSVLLSFWLPILLSAIVVFVISSVVHMVLKWHASDYNGFANEDAVREAIRASQAGPGRYVIPHCKDMKEMASPAMKQKYAEGPIGHVTLGPVGFPSMGKYLGLWFLQTLLVSAVLTVLVANVIPFDPRLAVKAAKLAGGIAFIAYGFGTITESIWGMRPWGSSAKYLLDAVLYGAGVGAVFYFFWR